MLATNDRMLRIPLVNYFKTTATVAGVLLLLFRSFGTTGQLFARYFLRLLTWCGCLTGVFTALRSRWWGTLFVDLECVNDVNLLWCLAGELRAIVGFSFEASDTDLCRLFIYFCGIFHTLRTFSVQCIDISYFDTTRNRFFLFGTTIALIWLNPHCTRVGREHRLQSLDLVLGWLFETDLMFQ